MNDTTPRTEQSEEFQLLRHQFKALQTHWESLKRTRSRAPRGRSMSYSSEDESSVVRTLQLMADSSPRGLMSSLQNRGLASPDSWEEGKDDLAAEQIRKERRVAIDSGKLKGRRLNWDDVDDDDDDGVGLILAASGPDFDENFGNEQFAGGDYGCDDEYYRCSSSSSSLSEEKLELERKNLGEVGNGKERRVRIANSSWGIRSKFLVGIIVFMVLMITVGIFSITSLAGEDDAILVPT